MYKNEQILKGIVGGGYPQISVVTFSSRQLHTTCVTTHLLWQLQLGPELGSQVEKPQGDGDDRSNQDGLYKQRHLV